MSRIFLGLSTSGHDPALALVDEAGRVAFAEATERSLRDKRAWGVAPDHISHLECALIAAGFDKTVDELIVACSWSGVKAEIPIEVSDALLPATDGLWLRRLQSQIQTNAGASLLGLGLVRQMPSVMGFDHHLCHAVNACWQSPLHDATCVVIDGEGEVGSMSVYDLRGRKLKRRWRSWGPGSFGTYYAWLTNGCGFDWKLGEEWKVMGLAGFGTVQPDLAEALEAMLIMENGRPRFADDAVLSVAREMAGRYGRRRVDPIMQAADLAATGQAVYGRMVDRLLEACRRETPGALILAGGCALNSSYNGTIAGRTGFDPVFVPSAPADDGNAVGAALLAWMSAQGLAVIPESDGSAYLGNRPDPHSLERLLSHSDGLKVSDLGGRSAETVAERLAAGKILGVMRGRAEFGPRALGHRSILADPRPAGMKDRINQRIKGREAYRPFAPVLPAVKADAWFERVQLSPYMSFTLPWRVSRRAQVPAVVHEDGTGRLQTVCADSAPWMNALLSHFEARTDIPIVLNTSFNIMGKPIVDMAEDAVAMLMTSGLDGVVIEDILLEKG